MSATAALPRVCVAIPALDAAGAIVAARSFAAGGAEVVIVDNGAGIDAAALPERTRVLRPERNVGYGAAANLAARATEAEVLLVSNDDVIADPGCVAALAAAFRDPGVDHAGGVLRTVDGRIDSAGIALDRALRGYDVRRLRDDGAPVPEPVAASGAAVAYRRTTFLALGGFAEELLAYWEDVDLALRLHARGGRFAFVPQATAVHARGTALGGRSAAQRDLDAFGRGFVLGRYGAWLGPADRLAVALVDWPSLARGVLLHRSVSHLRRRRAGRRAGRCAAPVARPGRVPVTRGVRATLRRQWGRERGVT